MSTLDTVLVALVTGKASTLTSADLDALVAALSSGSQPDLGLLCVSKLVEAAQDPSTLSALVDAGIVPRLQPLAAAPSLRVKEALANLCVLLTSTESLSAQFVAQGGVAALHDIVAGLLVIPSAKTAYVPPDTKILLAACEVYAKLVVQSPSQRLEPVYVLAAHLASTPAQRGLAFLALSGAAVDPAVGSAIVSASITIPPATPAAAAYTQRMGTVIEGQLLNAPVARVASHLVAQLTKSRAGWYYWSGETEAFAFPGEEGDVPAVEGDKAAARLAVLVLLLDADDLAIRRSAAAALSLLAQSPRVCDTLLNMHLKTAAGEAPAQMWARVADLFEPEGKRPDESKAGARGERVGVPDPQLAERGAVLADHLLVHASKDKTEIQKAKEAGLPDALVSALQVDLGDEVAGHLKNAMRILQ